MVKNKKEVLEFWGKITPLQLQALILKSKVDGFNAGFGKKVRRVIFCKQSGEYVEQVSTQDGWLCLHD